MYYIVHKQDNLTQTSIHLSMHDHPVANLEGRSREMFKQVKSLFEKEAFHTPRAIA
jgi:hypothetical protein